jgi:hypothetical protein
LAGRDLVGVETARDLAQRPAGSVLATDPLGDPGRHGGWPANRRSHGPGWNGSAPLSRVPLEIVHRDQHPAALDLDRLHDRDDAPTHRRSGYAQRLGRLQDRIREPLNAVSLTDRRWIRGMPPRLLNPALVAMT